MKNRSSFLESSKEGYLFNFPSWCYETSDYTFCAANCTMSYDLVLNEYILLLKYLQVSFNWTQ